jgi:hypothetical protein
MSMNKSFFTKVAGSSHYQKAISKCYEGHACQLIPEPDNPHDKKAVKVMRDKYHLGYLSKTVSSGYHLRTNEGKFYTCKIKNITGGTKDKPTKGVNLEITILDKKPSGCLSVLLLPAAILYPFISS